MELAHVVFQFWSKSKDPLYDRLLYEVVGAKDVDEARAILKQRMKLKSLRGLQVRMAYVVMDCS